MDDAERAYAHDLEGRVLLLRAHILALKAALVALSHDGTCWCDVAIGNPMQPRHSAACDLARLALKGPPEE